MMSESGSKDPSPSIVVGPNANLVLAVFPVLGRPQGCRCRPETIDPIEFAGGVCPRCPEAFHDRMSRLDVANFMRVMRTVPSAGNAAELEPIVVSDTVAVHRAVDHHAWLALAVRFEDPSQPLRILVIGKALIVEDHIKAISPLWIPIQFDLCLGARTTLVDHRHVDVSRLFESLFDDLFLAVVVVAAATDDQQRSNWLWWLGDRYRAPSNHKEG